MEFWGVEVKPGDSVKCDPVDKYIHISQASLGETKKDKGIESVPLFVKVNDQKLVLGTLSVDKCAQIQMDLVFEKEFELSHCSKNTSVYFCGYKSLAEEEEDDDQYALADSDSEEENLLGQTANGKPKVEVAKPTVKTDATSLKPKDKTEVPIKDDKPKIDEEDDDDDEDESDDEDDSSDDEATKDSGDDSDDEDDEDDDESPEEDDATPKAEAGKKRQAGSASKTPVPEKKAKLISPPGSQKTGGEGKKGGHTATPYPAKQVGKTLANNDKSKQQTPKSAGSVACKSCTRTFNSESALEAHSKAKHSATK